MKSLLIRNFRLFKELKIDRLGRVNLVVGKNNSGKTCLLEALLVYARNADPAILYKLVADREEDWSWIDNDRLEKSNFDIKHPFRFLFNDYRFPEAESGAIEIGPVEDERLRLKLFPADPNDYKPGGAEIKFPFTIGRLDPLTNSGLPLLARHSGSLHFITDLFGHGITKRWKDSLRTTNIQFVFSQGLEAGAEPVLWDRINITEMEDEVVKSLQLIDPNIKKIAMVGRKFGGNYRIPVVRYGDGDERVPLKSFGEGMVRIFHIALALVNAKGGFLLIDEFENGLHWTIQPSVWNVVFTMAERLNVKVFATTHSKDCIRGFHETWSQREPDGTFHRLDIRNKKIKAVSYTCETLADALETDVEVR
jgi:hypothetical protein